MINFTIEGFMLGLQIYLEIAVVLLLINSVFAGFNERRVDAWDVLESLTWPVYLMNELGSLVKIITTRKEPK